VQTNSASGASRAISSLQSVRLVDVAHGDDLHLGERPERREMRACDPPGPDHPDAHPVTLLGPAGREQRRH